MVNAWYPFLKEEAVKDGALTPVLRILACSWNLLWVVEQTQHSGLSSFSQSNEEVSTRDLLCLVKVSPRNLREKMSPPQEASPTATGI